MSIYYEVHSLLKRNRDKPLMDVLNDWALKKEKENVEKANVPSKKIPLLPTPSIRKLPDGFVTCPISICKQIIHQNDVMAHYIKKHKELKIERVFDDDTSAIEIVVDHNKMVKDEVYCLKLLSFGGRVKQRKQNLPVVGCRRIENSGLPSSYQHLAYDLPIIIMASRTIVGLPLKPEHRGVRHGRNMLVIWPITIETNTIARDIYCRIFVKHPPFLYNKATLVEMRSFRDSEWAARLLMYDPATFFLLDSDMYNLNVMAHGSAILGLKFKYSEYSLHLNAAVNTIKTKKERNSENESSTTFTIE